jgi:polyhydroxyalkanoate synthase
MDAFKVGRDMAVTPGKVVFQNEVMQLLQYAPATEQVYSTPLLFIPPWINKYYILDLNERKSLVKWLTEQGFTVFLVSWVNPDERQRDETFESYITKGGLTAIDKVLEETGEKSLNLAAYCIGGTMSATMLAWMAKVKDARVKSCTFFTALTDFEDAGDLQTFVDEATIKLVDQQMDKGYLPAEAMANAFNMLRSSDLIWNYVVNNYYLGKEPFPFDLLYWNADSTAMPAKVHHFYLERFYNENAFAQGELSLLGQPVEISDIKVPVYHVASKEDHIAPAAAVYRGARQMTGAKEVRFVLAGSGHIAGVVNPPAMEKYQHWVDGDLDAEELPDWLATAEERPGSWWEDWSKWLAKRSGKKVEPREPGAVLGALEEAPGSYVKRRFDEG